jgi:hypothetical protein
VAQAELVRCAARVAGLDYDCPGYAALAADATPAQQAYAAYLQGRWQGLNAGLLPEQHRGVLASGTLAGVQDPLARLVAAGALAEGGRITPADIAKAVDTASTRAGAGRCWPGWACRSSAPRPPAMPRRCSRSGGGSRWVTDSP